MRTSNYLLATLRETPAEAEIISQKLMLRAGMIRKLASGIYTWLPLGLRVLKKVEQIVREEMNNIGALEILMPAVQPAELWEETGRWETFGDQLLKIFDRHQHAFCFGPTHEEVITHLVRSEIHSYKQLPLTLYQIQTKFRDEIRPRFGVMRAREFMMKDAYSFNLSAESLAASYAAMHQAYCKIFTRIGLNFRAVLADSGNIGGNASQEFHVLANSGEDVLATCDKCDYAANLEKAESTITSSPTTEAAKPLTTIATPNQRTIEEVSNFLHVEPKQMLKTLIVKGTSTPWVALVLRGDHEVNEVKIAKLPAIHTPLTFIKDHEIAAVVGCNAGFFGPVALNIPIIAERDALLMNNFVCGANRNDQHLINVNWGRDLPIPESAIFRSVIEGDRCPNMNCTGSLHLTRGIEVGHIFQLGDKYSKAMGATVLGDQGKALTLTMGCYGIGISRTVAAAIEQNHDEHGIIWPDAIAPFQIALLPMSMHKSYRVREAAEKIYQDLVAAGYEVLLDDRKERAGVLFADMDLIGIPHRLIISESGLDAGTVEYKSRRGAVAENIPLDQLLAKCRELIKSITCNR